MIYYRLKKKVISAFVQIKIRTIILTLYSNQKKLQNFNLLPKSSILYWSVETIGAMV